MYQSSVPTILQLQLTTRRTKPQFMKFIINFGPRGFWKLGKIHTHSKSETMHKFPLSYEANAVEHKCTLVYGLSRTNSKMLPLCCENSKIWWERQGFTLCKWEVGEREKRRRGEEGAVQRRGGWNGGLVRKWCERQRGARELQPCSVYIFFFVLKEGSWSRNRVDNREAGANTLPVCTLTGRSREMVCSTVTFTRTPCLLACQFVAVAKCFRRLRNFRENQTLVLDRENGVLHRDFHANSLSAHLTSGRGREIFSLTAKILRIFFFKLTWSYLIFRRRVLPIFFFQRLIWLIEPAMSKPTVLIHTGNYNWLELNQNLYY